MKMNDLTGQRFGRLVVVSPAGLDRTRKNMTFLCKCDCGNEKIVSAPQLKSGCTKSCGCLKRELTSKRRTTHGKRNTRLYRIWANIKDRTSNPNQNRYYCYGAKGVSICDEWKDFQTFYDWAMSNGYSDELTIDRIDINGNYEPSNCRWATIVQQQNNTSRNHFLTYDGKTQTIAQWSEEYGIDAHKLRRRVVAYHWTIERALNTP